MTFSEISSLCSHLKRSRAVRTPKSFALQSWIEQNPEVDVREARGMCLMYGNTPWPSIDGNPPVYKDRPYYDARFFEKEM